MEILKIILIALYFTWLGYRLGFTYGVEIAKNNIKN